MQRLLISSAIAFTCAAATSLAQSVVIPRGFAATEGNSSTSYPWARTTAAMQIQYCYDASHFTNQAIYFPIVISSLKWRANSTTGTTTTTTTGGTYANVVVDLSTAAFDHAAVTATFANNHGPNRANVFAGPVTVLPTQDAATGQPNATYVDIPITPFVYDPSLGDLLIDISFPAASWSGGTAAALDCQTVGSRVSRIYNLANTPSPTGTVQQNVGPVVTVAYTPAPGLHAGFTSNVPGGPVPTTVSFTDTTLSSDPGGITSWAWDLDGDTVTDSTLQNPSFTYTACAAYSVRLTVTDATHPASTVTKAGFLQIGMGAITPSYTFSALAPGIFQFTDTSVPTPASWSWDFNGDQILDSSAQNPIWPFPPCTTTGNITLSVSSTCAGPWSTSATLVLVPSVTPSFTLAAIGSGVYQFNDTSTPTPQTWAWDFDGDLVTDSTVRNPTWTYPTPCIAANVTLSVTSACAGPWSTSTPIVVSPLAATAVPFTGGNGTGGATGVGNMFDVSVTAPAGISVCAITQGIYTYAGPFTADVYVTGDTYLGKEATASAWRLAASGSGVAAGGSQTPATPYPILLDESLYLPAGNYGIAIYLYRPGGSMNVAYTNGPLGPFVNPDITFFPNPTVAPGRSNTGLFTGAGFATRCWNGTFHYSKRGNGDEAGYGFAGAGCAGSMPVTKLSANAPPARGTTMTVALNNLPNSAAVLLIGLNNTTSALGPLPLDAAAYGAPGCSLRVSPDTTDLVIGSANAATWNLTVPGTAAFVGLLLFQQAIVLDSGWNGAGAVLSDAAGMMIGN